MKLSALGIAVLAGSAWSTANAQFTPSSSAPIRRISPTRPPGSAAWLVGGSDSCATPDVIAGFGTFAFDTSAATTGSEGQSEVLCYSFGSMAVENDVWFEWTAPGDDWASVATCGSTSVDTKIAAYPSTGGCPVPASALACNDDSCLPQSKIVFDVTVGSSYTIQIGNFPGAPGGSGSFDIDTTASPPCPDYTTGVSTMVVGLIGGGFICSLVRIDCLDDIVTLEATYGSPIFPGSVTNGAIVEIGIWDDPTNDDDPSDAVLLWTSQGVNNLTVVDGDTDIYDIHDIGALMGTSVPLPVTGTCWIGCVVEHVYGEFPASADGTYPQLPGTHYLAGQNTGPFDFANLATGNNIPPVPMAAIGLPESLMLRATGHGVGSGPGSAYCFGDGSAAPCPCGNDSVLAGSGCANGQAPGNEGATLTATGSDSVGVGNAMLHAVGLPHNQPGIFFRASNQLGGGGGIIFGDGLRCAGGAAVRIGVVVSNGDGAASLAIPDQPLGLTHYQYWYPDPGGSPCNSGFNLTNAYSVDWVP